MVVYRIYTEDINLDAIIEVVQDRFQGATFISGEGMYKGKTEQALIIEIHGEYDRDYATVVQVARDILAGNDQECVRVTSHLVTCKDIQIETE